MSDATSLWSPEIKATVQSPYAILEPQARALTRITNGILVGEIKKTAVEDGGIRYLFLDMVVPALDNARHRVLVASHRAGMMYPAKVDAECFRPGGSLENGGAGSVQWSRPGNEADSDTEFRRLVETVLHSPEVKAVAVSLIAVVNELNGDRSQQDSNLTAVDVSGGNGPENASVAGGEKEPAGSPSPHHRDDQ